jgi:hypothetical protein
MECSVTELSNPRGVDKVNVTFARPSRTTASDRIIERSETVTKMFDTFWAGYIDILLPQLHFRNDRTAIDGEFIDHRMREMKDRF